MPVSQEEVSESTTPQRKGKARYEAKYEQVKHLPQCATNEDIKVVLMDMRDANKSTAAERYRWMFGSPSPALESDKNFHYERQFNDETRVFGTNAGAFLFSKELQVALEKAEKEKDMKKKALKERKEEKERKQTEKRKRQTEKDAEEE